MEAVAVISGGYESSPQDREEYRTRLEVPVVGNKTTFCHANYSRRKVDGSRMSQINNVVLAPIQSQAVRAPDERSLKGQTLVVRGGVQYVVGVLATLARNGDIDQAQSSAAERWYRDYVMGVMGARDPEAQRSGKAPDIHASMIARTAAVGRCRGVRNGLGLCSEVRLKLLLIDELSFSVIATRLFPGDVNGRKKIAAQMAFLLEQLAELYRTLDQRPHSSAISEWSA